MVRAKTMITTIKTFITAALLALCTIVSTHAPAGAADKTVGVIMTGDITFYKQIHDAFEKRIGGQAGVKVVLQTPAPEPMAWTNAARKLVAIGSDVIVAYGAPATLTAMKQTNTLPIVFAGVYDPEAMQIMGKNATGISSQISMEALLKDLKQIRDFKSLGVIFNKAEKDTILQVKEIKAVEGKLGFKSTLYNSEQEGYAATITGVDAILLTTSCTAMCGVNDVLKVASANKLPTAASISGGKGVILTKSASPDEQGKVAAETVIAVLGGKSPASIPMITPKEIVTIINQKEADSMGISVPASLAKSATEVIK